MRIAAVQLAARAVQEADLALDESLRAIDRAGGLGAALVVLPECTWPGYILGSSWARRRRDLPPVTQVLDRYGMAAAQAGVVLVVGIAVPDDDTTRNTAVVWDRDGKLLGMADKRFLWDFDSRWFTAGDASPVFDTAVGRVGVMVCADGRMPEIARMLAIQGAEILLDPTAWVTTGADARTWTNLQYEHMLPTRARENGVWSVAANKVGIERDAVAYCGRSCIIDPSGAVVAEAPTDAPGIALWDCQTSAADPPVDRHPELYTRLVDPTVHLPITGMTAGALVPGTADHRIAVDTLERTRTPADDEMLADLGVALLVSHRNGQRGNGSIDVLSAADPDAAELHGRGGAVRWERTHGPDAPGTAIGPVVESRAGRLGVLVRDDGLVPEVSRCLMLGGADLLVWFADDLDVAGVAASRAAENRVHVVVCTPPGATTTARVIDPDGAIVADAGRGSRLISAVLAGCEPRRKAMAPGTDVVAGRQPQTYAALIAPDPLARRARASEEVGR